MDGTDASGFEGTETGMGQGLAYVLPQSRTVGYFMQLANEKAQERRQQAALLAQRQQKANEEYAQHLYAYKTPEIARDYTNWLQPKFDSLLDQASQYHATTGGDPFTNPNFIKQFNDLTSVAKNTHEANLTHTAYATQLADKSKNYTPESKQAGIDWLNNYQKDPVGNLYTAPPPLTERNLDMNDAVKLGHSTPMQFPQGGYNVTVPNRHNHIVQGQTILSQPEFAPLLQQNGINPAIGDIGGIPNGHGGTIYPTTVPEVNAIADHIIQNAAQPHFAQTLQVANINPTDPHAKDKLVDVITRQNAGYGKVYSDFANRLDANVENKKVPDYGEARLSIAEERLRLAQEKAAGGAANPTYFQDLSERMRTGTPGSGEEFAQQVKQNPAYRGQPVHYDLDDPTAVKITVPPQYKYDPQNKDAAKDGWVLTKQGYTKVLDSTDPTQWTAGFAPIYKNVTGDNTAIPTKALTTAGKGHVQGGQYYKQPQGLQSKPKGTVSYTVDGTQYNIPADKAKAFEAQFPNAKKQ